MMRFLTLAVAAVALLQAPTSTSGADAVTGLWRGTARSAKTLDTPQTAELAFDIRALQGGVGLYMTLPRLHAWRMPVGYLTVNADGVWSIPDWHLTLRRRGDALVGELGDPRVTFELRKVEALPSAAPVPQYGPGPESVWTYDAGAPVWASVAAFEDVVYAADTSGGIHAVRATTGIRVWSTGGGAPVYGAPLVTPEAVFVFDDAGTVRRLDRGNGHEQWRVELGADAARRVLPAADIFTFDFHAPTPELADGRLFVPSSDGTVHALDAATGRPTWKANVGGKVRASVAVSPSLVFVPTLSNEVVALNRADGTVRWRYTTTGPVTAAPVVAGDVVLVAHRGAWIEALRATTGTALWSRYDWYSWIESTGVVSGNTYIVGSSDLRAVRAIDIPTGRTIWETDVLGWAWGTPALDRDTVYIGVAGPQTYVTKHAAGLLALDRRTGAVQWRRPMTADPSRFVSGYPGSVAITRGTLVAPNVAGRLEGYALAPSDRHHHALTYDSAAQRVILLGGTRIDESGATRFISNNARRGEVVLFGGLSSRRDVIDPNIRGDGIPRRSPLQGDREVIEHQRLRLGRQ